MLRPMWPNSPALLCAPRSSCPSIAMPTPTPSEAFTNATGPSTGACPRTAQTWASTQAFTSFSTTTGSPIAVAQRLLQVEVAPAERRGVAQAPALEVHEPGHHDAHAQALPELGMLGQHALEVPRQVLDEAVRRADVSGTPGCPAAGSRAGRSRAAACGSR